MADLHNPRFKKNKLIPLKYSWEEANERRSKGLCIFCEEQETSLHYLKHNNLRLVWIDEDTYLNCDDDRIPETEATIHKIDEKPDQEMILKESEECSEMLLNNSPRRDSSHIQKEKASLSYSETIHDDQAIMRKESSNDKEIILFPPRVSITSDEEVNQLEEDSFPKRTVVLEDSQELLKPTKMVESNTDTRLLDDEQSQVLASVLEPSCMIYNNPRMLHDDVRKEEFQSSYDCGNFKTDALEMFDQMSFGLTSTEKPMKLFKSWKFKFKVSLEQVEDVSDPTPGEDRVLETRLPIVTEEIKTVPDAEMILKEPLLLTYSHEVMKQSQMVDKPTSISLLGVKESIELTDSLLEPNRVWSQVLQSQIQEIETATILYLPVQELVTLSQRSTSGDRFHCTYQHCDTRPRRTYKEKLTNKFPKNWKFKFKISLERHGSCDWMRGLMHQRSDTTKEESIKQEINENHLREKDFRVVDDKVQVSHKEELDTVKEANVIAKQKMTSLKNVYEKSSRWEDFTTLRDHSRLMQYQLASSRVLQDDVLKQKDLLPSDATNLQSDFDRQVFQSQKLAEDIRNYKKNIGRVLEQSVTDSLIKIMVKPSFLPLAQKGELLLYPRMLLVAPQEYANNLQVEGCNDNRIWDPGGFSLNFRGGNLGILLW